MSELSQMFWTVAATAVVVGVIVLVGLRASRFGNGRGERVPAPQPAAPSQPPAPQEPPLADPLRLELYVLENGMRSAPEVSTPEELALIPPFRRLVEHLARPEFDDEALAAYVTGEKIYPAWAALHALALRPLNADIETRAYHWLNQFHPWTRDLTLRLLEAWHPDDPLLARNVLLRLSGGWCSDARTTVRPL